MENYLDKRNFLNWYCRYATTKEIEKAVQNNRKTINRLISEYSYEIEKINATKSLYGCLSSPEEILQERYPLDCV